MASASARTSRGAGTVRAAPTSAARCGSSNPQRVTACGASSSCLGTNRLRYQSAGTGTLVSRAAAAISAKALFARQKMGLVALASGERAHVTRPTAKNLVRELSGAARQLLAAPEGVRHFQEARQLLECALAREAARKSTPHGMRALFDAMEAHRTATRREPAIAADIAFHFRIAEMSGNPVLAALHTAFGEWLREQRATSVQVDGAKRAAEIAHRRVYDAILARNPDAAATAMAGHLHEVEDFYWKATQQGRSEKPSPAPGAVPRKRRAAG